MKIKTKEFKPGYDKSDFYSIMGKFFAEKKHRKEMPYLINTDKKTWILFYEDDRLMAFYAHEKRKELTEVSGIYVLEEYRKFGLCHYIIKDAIKKFDWIRIISNTDSLLYILKENGFMEISEKGSYKIMERRIENGTETNNQ